MKKPDLKLSEPIQFYDGEITLRFDEGSWTYYRILPDGGLEAQSGVTGVCGIIDKSMYLIPWACKMMYLKMLRTTPRTPDDQVGQMAWSEFDTLLQEAKKAHKERLDDAGDVGSAAHAWIEDTIRNAITFNGGIVDKMNDLAPTDERSINCGMAAFDWMQKHNVRWLTTERKIYSRQYKYAGTCDGTALVDNCDNPACCTRLFMDELSLIDWKSSNQLSVQYLYQTAAYQNAIMEEEPATVIKSRWILRLGKEDGKFEPWYEVNFAQDFAGYLACLNLQRAHKSVEKRMSDQKKLKTFRRREDAKDQKKKIGFATRKDTKQPALDFDNENE
jgi:hypothetical protein